MDLTNRIGFPFVLVSMLLMGVSGGSRAAPPTVPDIRAMQLTEGVNDNITVPAFVDPEGETVSYSYEGLPAWLSVYNPSVNPRFLLGRPPFSESGPNTNKTYWITVTATDLDGEISRKAFPLTILNADAPPQRPDQIPAQFAIEGEIFSYSVPAFPDPDGETVSYAYSGLPAWLTIYNPSANPRFLYGRPPFTESGPNNARTYWITVTASDPAGNSASRAFPLTVNNVVEGPRAPVLQDISFLEGQLVSHSIPRFWHPDNDTMTYQVSGLPDWLEVYNPAVNPRFIYGRVPTELVPPDREIALPITVTATDSQGQSANAQFNVIVKGPLSIFEDLTAFEFDDLASDPRIATMTFDDGLSYEYFGAKQADGLPASIDFARITNTANPDEEIFVNYNDDLRPAKIVDADGNQLTFDWSTRGVVSFNARTASGQSTQSSFLFDHEGSAQANNAVNDSSATYSAQDAIGSQQLIYVRKCGLPAETTPNSIGVRVVGVDTNNLNIRTSERWIEAEKAPEFGPGYYKAFIPSLSAQRLTENQVAQACEAIGVAETVGCAAINGTSLLAASLMCGRAAVAADAVTLPTFVEIPALFAACEAVVAASAAYCAIANTDPSLPPVSESVCKVTGAVAGSIPETTINWRITAEATIGETTIRQTADPVSATNPPQGGFQLDFGGNPEIMSLALQGSPGNGEIFACSNYQVTAETACTDGWSAELSIAGTDDYEYSLARTLMPGAMNIETPYVPGADAGIYDVVLLRLTPPANIPAAPLSRSLVAHFRPRGNGAPNVCDNERPGLDGEVEVYRYNRYGLWPLTVRTETIDRVGSGSGTSVQTLDSFYSTASTYGITDAQRTVCKVDGEWIPKSYSATSRIDTGDVSNFVSSLSISTLGILRHKEFTTYTNNWNTDTVRNREFSEWRSSATLQEGGNGFRDYSRYSSRVRNRKIWDSWYTDIDGETIQTTVGSFVYPDADFYLNTNLVYVNTLQPGSTIPPECY